MNEVMIHEMLRYFYHELSEEETGNYEHFLKDNPYLMEIYQGYTDTLHSLSTGQHSPSQSTLDRIMFYAQKGHLPAS